MSTRTDTLPSAGGSPVAPTSAPVAPPQSAPADGPSAHRAARAPIAWVAWVRLVAILGVISIHNAGANAAAARAGDHRPAHLLGVALDLPFSVAVPVFVMVSGALTLSPASFRGTGHYLRKRVLRTVPAIVVWHLAYVAFLQLCWYPEPLAARDVVQRILTGRLAPHLYFLWIVLGLSLMAPVLIRWLAQSSRREQVLTGAALAAMPVLSSATRSWRATQAVAVETPWTWWVCYLGLFVLGWALRDVVLRGSALAVAAALGIGLPALVSWQYANPGLAPRLDQLLPVSYYGGSVVLGAVCVFLVARSTIRPGGALGLLARPGVVRWVNPLAIASLGIYACHILVMWTLMKVGILGAPVLSGPDLVLRLLLIAVISTVITLVARRIPVVRQVF
ncbi:acyltransferase [Arsenicicoccus dermatophilus]|uniref:acyltransferase n=1 Tax=Arsenicicoccus dermatophilus TaxID=1076331 RepID=UPI001F4D015D|nr:acyltransferase [Arsenicicoccus dermatophilus]MCH8614102.1 acyltransferase [Arsenicicoccus dermatophilus]